MTTPLDRPTLDRLLDATTGPVALHLREELLPVEGRGAPFFPATFASDDKYNIDRLPDGTSVCLVDSVGSQANRMEPLFETEPLDELVPQVSIRYGDESKGTDGIVNLLRAGHRLGDALVRCTELADEAHEAFVALGRGDADPMARIAPTSLVFGAWDSRDTGTKIPRTVQSTIRAWDVSRLSRSAQFVPALDYSALEVMAAEDELKSSDKAGYAERGFLHVPSTGDPGGIVARGPIRRDLTINLVALRRLRGQDTPSLQRYLLGLSLVAATTPQDPFLRQGCLLVPDTEHPAVWTLVERHGERAEVAVDQELALTWAGETAKAFGVAASRDLTFDAKRAKDDMKKGGKKGK